MISDALAPEFDQCIKCGLCQATCPVCKELLLEKYTPRGKIQLARYFNQKTINPSDHLRDIFAKCLLCGACVQTCPSGVDLRKVFMGMREQIAGIQGLHPAVKKTAAAVSRRHNISGEDNLERADWLESVSLSQPASRYNRLQAEVIYFVGCVASFFPMVQHIPENFVSILDRAGVDFTILAGEEWCCGFPLAGAGVPDQMATLIQHNTARIRATGAQSIVFSCPSCLAAWKEFYPAEQKLYHSTEFLEQLIDRGQLAFNALPVTVTYHDPCDLGRNAGIYEPPRRVLQAIPELKLVELENNRSKCMCCGGGGNVEMVDATISSSVAHKKLAEIEETEARMMVTSCQQCIRTIKSLVRKQKSSLEVLDVTELVCRAMQ